MQIESHAPWARVRVGVLERCLILDRIGVDQCVTFLDSQAKTVMVAGPVEPRLTVETRDIDHERVVLPAAIGHAHPTIDCVLDLSAHVDDARGACKLIREQNVLWRLKNLQGLGQVVGPRYAGQVALELRVFLPAIGEVLLLAGSGLRKIGNLASLDDSAARRNGTDRAEFGRSGHGIVDFDVPVRRCQRLPHAAEVRAAVGRARYRCLGVGLACDNHPPDQCNGCGDQG